MSPSHPDGRPQDGRPLMRMADGLDPVPANDDKHPQATAAVFQCPGGPHVLCDVVKLPCGQTICRSCIPKGYSRPGIQRTWPGTPDRFQGFLCPCCENEHPIGDCWPDYLSNQALKKVKELLRSLDGAQEDELLRAAFGALQIDTAPQLAPCGRLFNPGETPPDRAFDKMDSLLRREMDCAICCALLYEPWTTPCGHSFCQHCLTNAMLRDLRCPTCRTPLAPHQLGSRVSLPNDFLKRVTTYFWSPEVALREEIIRREGPYPTLDDSGLNTPLFICVASMPAMPTLLHVFEPKYKALVDRVWKDGQGARHFGMITPADLPSDGVGAVGVHLRVENVQYLLDGRSFLDTSGASRFRIRRLGTHPHGYATADVENFDDVSLYEEELREVAELNGVISPPYHNFRDVTTATFKALPTRELMDYAQHAVQRMIATCPSWLNHKIRDFYGQCPTDPVTFPWWLGSIIPVDESLKVQLLRQITVRDRMKMCCEWLWLWEGRNYRSW